MIELNRALLTPAFSLTELQKSNLLTDELSSHILSIAGVDEIICQQEICVSIDGMETVIMSMNPADYKNCKGSVTDGAL